jgi:hypothetical protein
MSSEFLGSSTPNLEGTKCEVLKTTSAFGSKAPGAPPPTYLHSYLSPLIQELLHDVMDFFLI